MTRETKLGLVVSCTFLCLLGAVLYIKWTEPKSDNQDTSFARADGVVPEVPADPKPIPTAEAPATTVGDDNTSSGAAPSLPGETHHDPLVTRASADATSSATDLDKKHAEPAPLPPHPPSNTISNDAPAPTLPTPAADANPPRDEKDSSPPVAPVPDSLRPELKGELANQSKDEKHTEGASTFPSAPAPTIGSADNSKPDSTVPALASGGAVNDKLIVPAPLPATEAPAPTPPSGSGFTPAPLPGESRPERPTTDTSNDHRPAPLPFPPKPEPAPGASGLMPERRSDAHPSVVDKADQGLNRKSNDTTPLADNPEKPAIGTANTTTPAIGSGQPSRLGDSWDRPEPTPSVPPLGKPGPAAPLSAASTPSPIIGAQDDHQAHIGSNPIRGTNTDSPRPYPPLGSPTTGTSPPIAVPAPSSALRSANATLPRVDSYDEQTHVCAQGDTFESISMKFYGTTDLAAALMQFNHAHPRAAAPMLQNPPALSSGVAVYIPPARILQNQSNAVGSPTKSPVLVATAGAGKVPTEPAKAAGGLQYKVRRSDEMIPLIARDVLGSVDRWTEIYQINNRSFDPSRPIPAGTVLALPADAKVPPENVP